MLFYTVFAQNLLYFSIFNTVSAHLIVERAQCAATKSVKTNFFITGILYGFPQKTIQQIFTVPILTKPCYNHSIIKYS